MATAQETELVRRIEGRLANLEQAATTNSDNLSSHKTAYDLTVAKLKEFADQVQDQSANVVNKFTSQDAMLEQIKNWATVSETNQKDIKRVLEGQAVINKAHSDEVAARLSTAQQIDISRQAHEQFTIDQSQKMTEHSQKVDAELTSIKAFMTTVNNIVNANGIVDQAMQDLATGISTKHNENLNRLQAM
jgi:hypothetical protein